MKAVIVYESMYGNTHDIADAIADGLRTHGETIVVPVCQAHPDVLGAADLVVVGGPTHAHGVSRPATRDGAVAAAAKPGATLKLEPDAAGTGLREWFSTLGTMSSRAAAFDTRRALPPIVTGRASRGIARLLRHHHATVIAQPQSFLVNKENQLEPGQRDSARAWGVQLGAEVVAVAP